MNRTSPRGAKDPLGDEPARGGPGGPHDADGIEPDVQPPPAQRGPVAWRRDRGWTEARIFIVDDEPANVTLLERTLRKAGYEHLVTFTQPGEFMPRFEAETPDLILLDLVMPEPDGFEILRFVTERPDATGGPPVLVLTADVTRKTRDRALRAGAMDFVTKPFDASEVLLRVRNLLARRALELDLLVHNEALEERVRARTRDLRDLLGRLVRAQEEERARIAVDIHDDPVQAMVAAGLRLDLLTRRLTDPEQRSAAEAVRHSVEEAMLRLRGLMFDLRPPALDDDGLAVALEQHLERRFADGPSYEVVDRLSEEPPPILRTVLFRIAQEALANVRRHAGAEHIKLALEEADDGIMLSVRDDGRGFDARQDMSTSGHFGLAAMAERAAAADGWCRVESTPETGTLVTAWVPRSVDAPATRPAATGATDQGGLARWLASDRPAWAPRRPGQGRQPAPRTNPRDPHGTPSHDTLTHEPGSSLR